MVAAMFITLLQMNSALPMLNKRNGAIKLLIVDNDIQVEEQINETFPEILRSNVSPDEYLRARGYNVSATAILPFLTNQQLTGKHSLIVMNKNNFAFKKQLMSPEMYFERDMGCGQVLILYRVRSPCQEFRFQFLIKHLKVSKTFQSLICSTHFVLKKDQSSCPV